jgi:membrane protease YdiL (CAAX protease family)
LKPQQAQEAVASNRWADIRWWQTISYLPVLYGIGWLLARPLAWLAPQLRPDQVDLCGAILALGLMVYTLPRRLSRLWGETQTWQRLGISGQPLACMRALLRGGLKAVLLLVGLVAVLLLTHKAQWIGEWKTGIVINAIALAIGVGFAEELVFRGWLWGELSLMMSAQRSLGLQAAIFALLHPWYNEKGLPAIALLTGLMLLGVALALQRRADQGLLWGAIGLHGGLVGGLFLLQNGLMKLNDNPPAWLVGPGVANPNPIGGLIGIVGLGILILIRWPHWPASRKSLSQS